MGGGYEGVCRLWVSVGMCVGCGWVVGVCGCVCRLWVGCGG